MIGDTPPSLHQKNPRLVNIFYPEPTEMAETCSV